MGARSTTLGLVVLSLVSGCVEPPPAPPRQAAEILAALAPTPVLEGSPLAISALGIDPYLSPTLTVRGPAGTVHLELDAAAAGGALVFRATKELVAAMGAASEHLDLVVADDRALTPPFGVTWSFAASLDVALDAAPSGAYHRNDELVLDGAGFLADGEGSLRAVFHGIFTSDEGPSWAVDTELPVALASPTSRAQGLVRLSTALGGIDPGTYDGTIELTSDLRSGKSSRSAVLPLTLTFERPALYAFEPPTASLEQRIELVGGGFLGHPAEPDETTVIRLTGTFTPDEGARREVTAVEVLPVWVSGTTARATLEATVQGGRLVSSLFGSRSGRFDGHATPVVFKGTRAVEGAPSPVSLTLAPVRQVAWLKFLPGFYASLARFGLTAAEGVIESRIAERLAGVYAGWNLEVRLDEPTDYSTRGYAVVEIGGPDPNARGLFGYDNSPGKDVHNLRLYDHIGGANAETQADGFPGYGGVFVENFLFFSAHPGLPRPVEGPVVDPLFDEVFDPVRARPATPAELRGDASPERYAAVDRAVSALAKMIGETTAHELGHSLGMAEPFGPSNVFHNPIPGDGCLMDAGGQRPLGERIGEPGFASTRLCSDQLEYLDLILGH